MDKLAAGWHVISWGHYVIVGVAIQVVIRVVMSGLSALYIARSREEPGRPWSGLLWNCITGFHPNNKESDYLLPFALGLIEQLSYPVMMAAGGWTAIGAWLGFKTIVHWNRWASDRFIFNRYLLGNALVVVSAVFMIPYVKI